MSPSIPLLLHTLADHRKAQLRYACWEVSQNEFVPVLSVFERVLDVDPQSIPTPLGSLGSILAIANTRATFRCMARWGQGDREKCDRREGVIANSTVVQ